MTVREKIKNGEYKNKLPYPTGSDFTSKAARLDHRQNDLRIKLRFQNDVLRELGIENHPKSELLIEMAWNRGHSAGLQEVLQEAEELVELLN